MDERINPLKELIEVKKEKIKHLESTNNYKALAVHQKQLSEKKTELRRLKIGRFIS